ncbi:MAG TPA: 2-oxoglutarate dehydrogenase E1 component [Thermomicrobiales bacterium]|nr:2-oxoglutarate dehydrogenase E1 component [Thermomicrobiales bacterium]
MAQETTPTRQSARFAFHGPNAGYILELYDQYLSDPASVDAQTRAFFAEWTPPPVGGNGAAVTAAAAAPAAGVDVEKILAAANYAQSIRTYGHLAASIAPVTDARPPAPELDQQRFGLSDADLERLPAQVVDGPLVGQSRSAREAIERLRQVYCGSIGYEFDHVQDAEQRNWLRDAAETGAFHQPLDDEQKKALLQRLTEVEAFEKFLHTTYLGAKRFSVEGTDTGVPMLDVIVGDAARNGIREIVIGMAHRGRLNVLTHVLGKPYEAIFAEFEHGPRGGVSQTDTSDIGWTGDVKYHLGLRREAGAGSGTRVDVPIIMAPNPSHLEFVDPVVEGMARASQEDRENPGAPIHDPMGALPILIHGDAAFPGQGIVAETLNLSRLKGYTTGGTIHIITNNQIGYTTLPEDSRSTLYASDLAKGFEIPIVHVNADDAAACLEVARLAIAYRNQFKRDFLIDLIGYRRWGHNEGDEPTFTQPEMYARIAKHPTVRAIWAQQLEDEGVIGAGQGDQILAAEIDRLQQIREGSQATHPVEEGHQTPNSARPHEIETAVSSGVLHQINNALHTFPDDFVLNPKLKRQLERRKAALGADGAIDWALAESLAFGSILMEGTPIRLTGQDVQRGTFSQRHLVLHDPERGTLFSTLQSLPDAAAFAVWNSPLSESAALGFEYGYSVYAPETLVLWEGQFGDFANGGQVIIDQFIVAGQAKWRQTSSLVLLLPHGYEGQGPEHSSGRVERFLQLAANRNIRIANCTTSAQYFHLLRRQALLLESDPRPLVVMTPKSLLRHPRAGSSLRDLADGQFQMVIDDPVASERPKSVRRVVLCSGKVYVDLTNAEHENAEEVAVVRVELLHPFPAEQVRAVLERYASATEIVWLQEEPQNMGPWQYMYGKLNGLFQEMGSKATLSYIGRPEQASPAEGSADAHAEEQARIVQAAWTMAKKKAVASR